VSGWRAEITGDLSTAANRIESALTAPLGMMTADQIRLVWLAYIGVEKSVAFIRFDIGEENPGRFIRLRSYEVPDERQALSFALRYLKKGTEEFALGDFHRALKELRESRNYLRALLRRKRLERARNARGASYLRRLSSSSA